jgi:hypothetical protein
LGIQEQHRSFDRVLGKAQDYVQEDRYRVGAWKEGEGNLSQRTQRRNTGGTEKEKREEKGEEKGEEKD